MQTLIVGVFDVGPSIKYVVRSYWRELVLGVKAW